MTKERFDIYAEVTKRIAEQLEEELRKISNGENVDSWKKPWQRILTDAHNRVSKKPYSLLNQLLLKHNGEYATYKQWTDLGGKVRKGEKSEIVVFWKMIPVEEEKDGKKIKKTIPYLKYINVFHVSQVDGVEPRETNAIEHNPIEEAEEIIKAYNDREETLIIEDVVGDNAYYAPALDIIRVPVKEQFKSINEYYATKFHEMIHSTGHNSRLNRFKDGVALASFGSEDYSKEELIAEIGSATLMSHVGIETTQSFNNSVHYIQSWLEALKNDKKLIVSASGKAQKAVEYILDGNA